MCACTICGRSTFFRRFHLQSHDSKQISTGFSNDAVTTRMTAFTNMFHKMHLIRSACGRHDSKTFASHAAHASPGIIPSHSTSVGDTRALREPSAASASRYPGVGYLASVESRYKSPPPYGGGSYSLRWRREHLLRRGGA